MSLTLQFSDVSEPELLDIVDDEWARDRMPNDDIPLPEGIDPPTEDTTELGEEVEPQQKEHERWNDLGLNTLQ